MTTSDWAAFLGAGATFFVGLVAVCIAIRDGHRLERDRKARARLVAAYLFTPLARAHGLMGLGKLNLEKFADVTAGTASVHVRVHAQNLRSMCVEVPPLLSKFSLADAASLPEDVGEKLADAVQEAHAAIEWIKPAVDKYLFTVEHDTKFQLGDADELRFQHAHETAVFVPILTQATVDLGRFVTYCKKQFGDRKG